MPDFQKMFVLKSTVGFKSKTEVSVMHSDNCGVIIGHKRPGAQLSLFYSRKRG